MLNAVGMGHAAHLARDVPGFGAVVNIGKNMAMDIDHAEATGGVNPNKAKDAIQTDSLALTAGHVIVITAGTACVK